MAVERKKYQCSYCLKQFTGRRDGDEMLARTQKLQGCKELAPHLVDQIPLTDSNGWNSGSIKFTTCPGNLVDNSIGYWLELQTQYEKGVMPYNGPISKQPSKAMEIFGVVGDWKAEQKKKADEAASRKMRSGRNRTRS